MSSEHDGGGGGGGGGGGKSQLDWRTIAGGFVACTWNIAAAADGTTEKIMAITMIVGQEDSEAGEGVRERERERESVTSGSLSRCLCDTRMIKRRDCVRTPDQCGGAGGRPESSPDSLCSMTKTLSRQFPRR
jgi:hypothetical protein